MPIKPFFYIAITTSLINIMMLYLWHHCIKKLLHYNRNHSNMLNLNIKWFDAWNPWEILLSYQQNTNLETQKPNKHFRCLGYSQRFSSFLHLIFHIFGKSSFTPRESILLSDDKNKNNLPSDTVLSVWWSANLLLVFLLMDES